VHLKSLFTTACNSEATESDWQERKKSFREIKKSTWWRSMWKEQV